MKITDIYPSRFLSAADLQGQEAIATIDKVELEDFEGRRKPIVYFQDKEKGLVCNKTNFQSIAAIAGEDTDDWPDARIILYGAMVNFQGRVTEAIRVRRPPAKVTPTPSATGKTPPFDDAIEF